jgi:hypothetical protein
MLIVLDLYPAIVSIDRLLILLLPYPLGTAPVASRTTVLFLKDSRVSIPKISSVEIGI